MTGAGEEDEDEEEEEERPGAGKAEGGLEEGGSLPALPDGGEEEERGEEERKGFRGVGASTGLHSSSGGEIRDTMTSGEKQQKLQ